MVDKCVEINYLDYIDKCKSVDIIIMEETVNYLELNNNVLLTAIQFETASADQCYDFKKTENKSYCY